MNQNRLWLQVSCPFGPWALVLRVYVPCESELVQDPYLPYQVLSFSYNLRFLTTELIITRRVCARLHVFYYVDHQHHHVRFRWSLTIVFLNKLDVNYICFQIWRNPLVKLVHGECLFCFDKIWETVILASLIKLGLL